MLPIRSRRRSCSRARDTTRSVYRRPECQRVQSTTVRGRRALSAVSSRQFVSAGTVHTKSNTNCADGSTVSGLRNSAFWDPFVNAYGILTQGLLVSAFARRVTVTAGVPRAPAGLLTLCAQLRSASATSTSSNVERYCVGPPVQAFGSPQSDPPSSEKSPVHVLRVSPSKRTFSREGPDAVLVTRSRIRPVVSRWLARPVVVVRQALRVDELSLRDCATSKVEVRDRDGLA